MDEMMISPDVETSMNDLIAACFEGNAVVDNLSYNLDHYNYAEIAEVMHHGIAHLLPVLADKISDEMNLLLARPIRKAIKMDYDRDYNGDLKDIFQTLLDTLMLIRDKTRQMINAADMDDVYEIVSFGGGFLREVDVIIRQAQEWISALEHVSGPELNLNIKAYTHFLKYSGQHNQQS